MDRTDGRLKVTGAARYAAEFPMKNLAHAVVVRSTIARGRIQSIDTSAAEKSPGVLAVITHLNAPKLATIDPPEVSDRYLKVIPVLQDDRINHYGQHVGLVVAETFEQAQYAATLVRVAYTQERPALEFAANLNRAYAPERINAGYPTDTQQGDLERGLSAADVRIDVTYTTPIEHNNPIEPHATIAVWEGDRLTLYNSTQHVDANQTSVASTLRIPSSNVRVVCPYVGGGFGSKVPTREHVILAAIAAKQIGRPVKVVLSRAQMFTCVGHRPHSQQRMRLGAKRDGRLTAFAHESIMETAVFDEFAEQNGVMSRIMYECPNSLVTHRIVPLNLDRSMIMRAPGEAPGSFALESAMDELAYALKIDPIELRVRNEPPRDPESNLPWSSRSLVQCFREGAKRFGWEKRLDEPGSMREGRYLIGYGVAGATFPARRRPSSAIVRVLPDGRVQVHTGATDLGTGTYTVLTQVAAEALGVPPERVQVEIGDSNFPPTPASGGSFGAASFCTAVQEACIAVRQRLAALAREDANSPLRGANEEAIAAADGRLFTKGQSARGESYVAIMQRHNLAQGVEVRVDSKPDDAAQKFSMHAFGAHFVQVSVDPDTGVIRIPRFLCVIAAGRILNPKTARSQIVGGVVWGISMALHEETLLDARYGNYVNGNLGEYHVAVNADIPDIDVVFVEENDPHVNPLGIKGIGEIGIVGAAAAVANAIYHATGKRIRDLPITPDKLL